MNNGEEIVDKSVSDCTIRHIQHTVGSDTFDDSLMDDASFFDDFLNEEELDGVFVNSVSQKAKELELYYNLNSHDTTHDEDIPARQELLVDLPSLTHAQPEITLTSVGALTTADLPEDVSDDLDYELVQNLLFETDADWSTLGEPVDAYHQVELDENFDSDFHNAATTVSTPHSQGRNSTNDRTKSRVSIGSNIGVGFGEHEKLEADAPRVTVEATSNSSCSTSSSSSSSSSCDAPAATSGSSRKRATKRSSVASQQLPRNSSRGSQQQDLTSPGSLFSEHNFMTVHLDQVERLQAELARPTLSRDERDAIYAQILEYQTHIAKRQRALDHVARGRQLVEQQRREVLFYERVHSDYLQTATQLRDMRVHSLAPAQAPQQLSDAHNHWHQQTHQPPQPPLSNDNNGSSNNGRRRVIKREDIL